MSSGPTAVPRPRAATRARRSFGFYDLLVPEVRGAGRAGAEYGIYGFCYYHYWFDGKRLLDRPFDRFLASDPDLPFCHLLGQRELDPPVGRQGARRSARPGVRGRIDAEVFRSLRSLPS